MGIQPHILSDLNDRIRALESGKVSASGGSGGADWHDDRWPGLCAGAVHELIVGTGDARAATSRGTTWFPPIGLLASMAGDALRADPVHRGAVVWIGRVQPSVWAVGAWADRLILIDPPDAASRLWAIDLALRNTAVAAVVAEGSGLDLAATRRLQLAARAGGVMGLLARPPWEREELSAAATRWLIWPVVSPTDRPRWRVRLWRCKGVRPASDPAMERVALVEWDREKGVVHLPSELVDRPGAATLEAADGGRHGRGDERQRPAIRHDQPRVEPRHVEHHVEPRARRTA